MNRHFHFKKIHIVTICVFFLYLAGTSLYGQNKYLSFSKSENPYVKGVKEKSDEPVKEVNTKSGKTIVKYSIPCGYLADINKQEHGNFNYIHVSNFGKMTEAGKPALPAHSDIIAIPGTDNPVIKILSAKYVEYEGINIHPALEPARDTEGADAPEFKIDFETYNTNQFFPEKLVVVSEVLKYRGEPFASVQLRPVQFNPVTKKVRVYSEIEYEIIYSKERPKSFFRETQKNILRNSVINPEVFDNQNMPKYRSEDPEYLVVAKQKYAKSANLLAGWKAQLGYRTEVILQENWTSEQVKQAIHSRYETYNPKPSYFVIIGDHEQVPGEVLIQSDGDGDHEYTSDLYYACMDGEDDYFPDMAKGRISASTPFEAEAIVNKIINYEQNPVADASFYQNGLNCAQFQDKVDNDDTPDGYAARRFCHTSEEVRDYMTDLGYDVTRVYYTEPGNTPTHFNNGHYSDGQAIPGELLKANGFNWGGNAEDIATEINEGKFYVLHRDHGYGGGTGWAHPRFVTSDIDRLTNGDKLPVIFSMNCHTGEFMLDECFAERFLRYENGGAVGVIAASYYSYSGYNDGFTAGMFDAIWSDPGLIPNFGDSQQGTVQLPGKVENVRTMGDVLTQGLIRMRETWNGDAGGFEYTYRLFHYFGDPAMKMWIEQPASITANVQDTLSCGIDTLMITNISVSSGVATLVQGNTILASANITGQTLKFNFDAVDDKLPVYFTISVDGYKPFVQKLDVKGCTNKPVAAFDVDKEYIIISQTSKPTINFINLSSYNPEKYEWSITPKDFNFVNGTDSATASPQIKCNMPGVYSVSLKASNVNGDSILTKANLLTVESIDTAKCKPQTKILKYSLGIQHFQLQEINKKSGTAVSDGGYMDFTQEGFALLNKGYTYTFNITVGKWDPEYVAIFIDFNKDGDFDDAGEFLNKIGKFTGASTGEITIPENAPVSNQLLRMRVISDYFDITDGCYAPTYGQVEDYSVKIQSAVPYVDILDIHDISYTTAIADVKILTNGGEAISERGVIYTTDLSQNEADWTKVVSAASNNEFSETISGLTSQTEYYVKSYAVNSIGTGYSDNIEVFSTYSNNPPTEHVTSFAIDEISSATMSLSWNDSEGAIKPYGYYIKASKTGFDHILDPVNGTIETENDTMKIVAFGEEKVQFENLDYNTEYFFKIFPYVNEGTEILFKTDGTIPTVNDTTLKEGEYWDISFQYPYAMSLVKLNTILNNQERPAQSYIDYRSNYSTELKAESTYKLSISVNPGGSYNFYLKAWIDWDKNGLFEEDENISLGEIEGPGTLTKEFTVPADAIQEATTLRIVYMYVGSSGVVPKPYDPNLINYGSAEDYSIVVLDKSAPTPGQWDGTISNNWDDAGNWNNNVVPVANIPVVITTGAPNFPILSDTAICADIELQEGAELTLNENAVFGAGFGAIINTGAQININTGAKLTSAYNIQILNGGSLIVNGGESMVNGNLFVGEGTSGTFMMNNGQLDINGDIYSEIDCSIEINGGTLSAQNWKRAADNVWGKGQLSFSGGELNISNQMIISGFDTYATMDGPIVINIGGGMRNNAANWDVSDGTFVFKATEGDCFAYASSFDSTMIANNVVIENPTADFYFSRGKEGEETGMKILGDLSVKGNAHFVKNNIPVLGLEVMGNIISESGSNIVTDDATHILRGNINIQGDLNSNKSLFVLPGEKTQSVSCNGVFSQLILEKADSVHLNSNIEITDTLELKTGSLVLNGNALTFGANAAIKKINEMGADKMLVTDDNASVQYRINTAEKNVTIPMGVGNDYLPVIMSISDITPANKYIGIRMVSDAHPSVKGKGSMNRYWEVITESGIGDFQADISATYLETDLGVYVEDQLTPAFLTDAWRDAGGNFDFEFMISLTCYSEGIISALVKPQNNKTFTIDYINESTNENVPESYQYSSSVVFDNAVAGEGRKISLTPGTDMYFRATANDTSLSSETFKLIVPERPAAPVNPVVNDDANTFNWTNNSEYTAVSDYEISKDKGITWNDVENKPYTIGNVSLEAGDVLVKIKASNTEGEEHFTSKSLASDKNFTISTGIKNIEENRIEVYPVPSIGTIKITNIESSKCAIDVISTNGQLMYSVPSVQKGVNTIDLSQLANGLYYLRIKSGNKVEFEKIIIEK